MESNEGRSLGRSLRELKPVRGSSRSGPKDTWLGRNWSTVLILVAIVLLALFVRSYFGFSTAVDNGFLVAGGSDSYYHQRVIDYVNSEGSHLVQDPALNYPFGMRNARPPMFDWSVAIGSQVLSGISGMAISDAAGYSLLASSAIWGSLTCIPVYLITRGAFGNRAGILAALLFAFMPGHISRSVFANADHDAFILFFVVFALYFLMKALQSMKGTKWVSSWKKTDSIRTGIRSYFQQNQRSLIYSALGGVCIATVAMAWTGYTYILVIILVYFLVQVVINRFRNADSMGEFFIVGIMLLTAFVLAAPLYWQLSYWSQWFDVPFYLFLGSMFIGGFFTVTRDYPWTLTIPILVAIVAVALVGVFFIAPNLFEAIISGQGYLVKSKLYSTIDEASAPEFSTLVFSFGVVSFWLAIIGLVWAAIKIPKDQSPYLVFIVVWMAVSMYMAASAGRFVFNASPAFAMAAGWILALLISKVKFSEVPRLWAGFWSNPKSTLRKAFKLKHVAVALFLAFLIVLPNVWTALDAGIPSQTKTDYDREVYEAMPSFLRPDGYDVQNGTYWYFGAFGYSLPMPNTYWPTAWSWFKTQDADIADLEDRPAFLSWWDYGFEAIQEGQHPTVADNFQNGYEYAGSFITSQNESDAVALFIVRVLEKAKFTDATRQILQDGGVDVVKLEDIMNNPQNYVDEVKNNPLIYGAYDSELSANNAKYAAARIELQKVGLEDMVEIYNQLRAATGIDIGYFAVDGRLFPWSATSQTIFYAPAKLSDRVIDSTTNAPTDYYEILAVTQNYETKRISDLTASDYPIITYTIVYKEAFYNSMLYCSFMGLSPADIGSTNMQSFPGYNQMASYGAMPGYNLTHFKQVYRTAYYNPYTDATNHSDAWKAVSWEEALYLQEQIEAGAEGTVDMSVSALQSGVVFMQYYDGAIMEGVARATDGTPYADIYVTVLDEYGIPHQVVKTDSEGRYSAILPFGNVSVVYSSGTLNNATKIASELDRVDLYVTYAQAMREEPYHFDGDITLSAALVTGSVFYDNNGNGRYDAGTDELISDAQVTLTNPSTGFNETVTTSTTGSYRILGLAGSSQVLYATYNGHRLGETTVTLTASGNSNRSIAIMPASLTGTIKLQSGSAAGGVGLTLVDKVNGNKYYATSDSSGKYTFSNLLPGDYTLTTTDSSLSVGTQSITLTQGQSATQDLKLVQATTVSGTVTIGGVPQANVSVVFRSEQREISVMTNASGGYLVSLPRGEYSVYVLTVDGDGNKCAALESFSTGDADTVPPLNIELGPAAVLSGTVFKDLDGDGEQDTNESAVSGAIVVYTLPDGSYVKAVANAKGEYNVIVPTGTYFMYASGGGRSYWASDVQILADATTDIALGDSVYLTGKVFRDLDGDGEQDSGESGISGVLLSIWNSDEPGEKVRFVTGSNGNYNISVPAGSYIINATIEGYSTWQGDAGTGVSIALEAEDREVTGTVTDEDGISIGGVTVNFKPTGSSGQEDSAITDASGRFIASLEPGTYWVVIDQNISSGDDSSRYYYNSTLTVPISRDPDALDIEAAVQHKVVLDITGPSTYDSDSTIRIIGPENRTVGVNDLPLYLKPGTYTIYIDLTDEDDHYVYLGSVIVAPGLNDLGDLEAKVAHNLRGQLQHDGEDLSIPAAVNITYGPAVLPVTASSRGIFSVYLPAGDYTVSAEYTTKATLEDGSARYVRYYNSSMPVTVDAEEIEDFELLRDLNNSTVSLTANGAVSDVTWQFIGLSDTAIDHTVGSSPSSVSLAPGVYSVYAHDASGNVYLGIVDVKPDVGNTLSVTLAAGTEVSGHVTIGGEAKSGATITFADNAMVRTTTDANGDYSVFLPRGYYNVTAKVVVAENHPGPVNMTYARSFDLEVNGTAVPAKDTALELVDSAVVELVWSEANSIPTIAPGESVVYNVTIYNRGNVNDTYELSTTSDWGVEFSQKTVSLPWGTGTGQTVQVTITAPADAKVSHSPIKIVAKSTNRTGSQGTVSVDVDITPTYSVVVSQPSAPSTDGSTVTYKVLVKNTGTSSDIFVFSLTNPDDLRRDGWNATITGTSKHTQNLTIAAGASQTVSVTLTRTNSSAFTADIVLNVTAQSKNHGGTPATASLALNDADLSVADDKLTASGRGASMIMPGMTGTTWLLIALIVLALASVVILRVNKGVFGRRRKR
ncbi:carboxypeptidase regulatory-like domain-containing protein [Methanomassiliicoccus luminyensis]|uniref:carboxypeptidase regulatory-like domain-containing protein n=1 Tax=Methanomassiliicoccus luminyensis TaxID=1080712 RepID=UPI0009DA6F4A|nr:carboxypeptidase regulatory-like domain-containing protein [Methanomassiliicoccus luminyensis]